MVLHFKTVVENFFFTLLQTSKRNQTIEVYIEIKNKKGSKNCVPTSMMLIILFSPLDTVTIPTVVVISFAFNYYFLDIQSDWQDMFTKFMLQHTAILYKSTI